MNDDNELKIYGHGPWGVAHQKISHPEPQIIRRWLGLNCEDFASFLKIPVENVWKWEAKMSVPDEEEQKKIDNLLELNSKLSDLISNPDEVKGKLGFRYDYQLATALEITETTIVNWRNRLCTLSFKEKMKAVHLLELKRDEENY